MVEFLLWDFLQKIPLLSLIRIILYLILSVFGGAGLLYDKIVNPFLNKNEQKIDDGVELIKIKISMMFGNITSAIAAFAMKQFNEFIIKSLAKPSVEKNPKPSVEVPEEKKE
jgi:hypothetical protein